MSKSRSKLPRSPRVLHVISSFDGGGAERVLLTLLNGLTDLPQHLALGGDGALLPLVSPAVPVHPVRTEEQLADLMRRVRPDVVHTWLDNSLLMTVVPAAQLGVPVVHRIYNMPSVNQVYEPCAPGNHQKLARALRAIARVVSLSETAAEDAETFYGIARPPVIHNGFPLAGERSREGTRFKKPVGRLVILNVARLGVQKGHTYLADAFARIADRHPLAELWIAGIGPQEETLRAQAAAAGVTDRVRFMGFQEDVSALHAEADLFVFPSLSEGFGNALGEAMLAGLPIVATDLPVIRRDVLGGQAAAELFPPGDSVALARILDRLLADPSARAALGARACQASVRFEVGRMLDQYRQVYYELARTAMPVGIPLALPLVEPVLACE